MPVAIAGWTGHPALGIAFEAVLFSVPIGRCLAVVAALPVSRAVRAPAVTMATETTSLKSVEWVVSYWLVKSVSQRKVAVDAGC